MSRNSTGYLLFFAAMVTLVAGVVLAVTATVLKPFQERNVILEKKQFILTAVGFRAATAEEWERAYDEKITEIAIDREGNVVGDSAFHLNPIDIDRRLARDPHAQVELPLYRYDGPDGRVSYIIPVNGVGLWGPIWGYVALGEDFNQIQGVIFDHAAETPGLGAEITGDVFRNSFMNKKIYDENKTLVSVMVLKGVGNRVITDHQVDGISGSTITANGVSNMLMKDFKKYEPFFQQQLAN